MSLEGDCCSICMDGDMVDTCSNTSIMTPEADHCLIARMITLAMDRCTYTSIMTLKADSCLVIA